MGERPVKLNLGCGDRHWEGFVNIDDWRPGTKGGMKMPDISCDIRDMHDYVASNYADEIHAIHVLEHINRWETVATLREWYRVLKPGGLLVIEVPDLDKISYILYMGVSEPYKLKDRRIVNQYDDAMDGLYGDRKTKAEGMQHKWCFTYQELNCLMTENGFRNILKEEPFYHRPFRDMRLEARK